MYQLRLRSSVDRILWHLWISNRYIFKLLSIIVTRGLWTDLLLDLLNSGQGGNIIYIAPEFSPPVSAPLEVKWSSRYFPKRLELSLITVWALPRASIRGFTYRRETGLLLEHFFLCLPSLLSHCFLCFVSFFVSLFHLLFVPPSFLFSIHSLLSLICFLSCFSSVL